MIADPTVSARLFGGPVGPEGLAAHLARLGPPRAGGAATGLIADLERSGLKGHGGAGFPTWRKWRAVAERSRGDAVVVANGAEGEPASKKDRVLLAARPHLVLDGIELAAVALGARRALLCLPRGDARVETAVTEALAERRAAAVDTVPVELAWPPPRYVAGEETALLAFLEGRPARPTVVPPRPFERGLGGRPTLVQNVETLARAALVARRGAGAAPGSALLTLAGAVRAPGVYEVTLGASLGEVIEAAGGAAGDPEAVLLGGYFGSWWPAAAVWSRRLGDDLPIGAGVLAVLPEGACGLAETARIVAYLARESAGQCGPCVHGVAALAQTLSALVGGEARPGDGERLTRWAGQVRGRGACRHPDGAATLVESALRCFGAGLGRHLRGRGCAGCARPSLLPVPVHPGGWR